MSNPGGDALIDRVFQAHFTPVGPEVRPIQRKVIGSVLEGHNTLALMPTGSGKSLCYWIAGKALGGTTIVISPLTSLINEQAQKLEECGCRTCVLHAGIAASIQHKKLLALYSNLSKPDFIFLSPERLATDGFVEYVLRSIRQHIKLCVVDEAHCISQWGLDFRPFYREIPHFLRAVCQERPLPTVLCLTATLNPKDQQQICADFAIETGHVIKADMLLRPSIDISVVKVGDENAKDQQFWQLLEQHKQEKVLVYHDRKHGKRSVEDLCAEGLRRGFRAQFFHADLPPEDKDTIREQFRTGEILTVFATSAFGMGIDIPDIRGVIHYMLTESVEQYYQQIGRVGRDNKRSWAVLFYSDKNISVRRRDFIEKSFPTEDSIKRGFTMLTNEQTGLVPVSYFEYGDDEKSSYHYLVRSSTISYVCKGLQSLSVFKPAPGNALPEFDRYLAATKNKALLFTATRLGLSPQAILDEIYRWLAEGKVIPTHALGKCIIVDCHVAALPDDLMTQILADVAEKKQYRLDAFAEFVDVISQYTDSMAFHRLIGERLGVDRFSLGRVHETLAHDWVRSKSEVIIANILHQSRVPYAYEQTLRAADGTWCVPDFTVSWQGKAYYWEHLGMLDVDSYRADWGAKKAWYALHFPGQLLTTQDGSTLSNDAKSLIAAHFQSPSPETRP